MPRLQTAFRTAGDLAIAAASPALRPLIPAIWRWSRSLPARYEARPLPDFLDAITPRTADLAAVDAEGLRRLLDALARLDRRSPFGLCMRRSLWRYHWLRRAGLPLGIVFAVRFKGEREAGANRIAGHAWNTLHREPWHEQAPDYRGFTVLYRWPQPST